MLKLNIWTPAVTGKRPVTVYFHAGGSRSANTKPCEHGTGNTPEAQVLASNMAAAWVNFAKTGNPSQPGLTWTPSDPSRCQPMVFDNHCRMQDDPEGELRRILLI